MRKISDKFCLPADIRALATIDVMLESLFEYVNIVKCSQQVQKVFLTSYSTRPLRTTQERASNCTCVFSVISYDYVASHFCRLERRLPRFGAAPDSKVANHCDNSKTKIDLKSCCQRFIVIIGISFISHTKISSE